MSRTISLQLLLCALVFPLVFRLSSALQTPDAPPLAQTVRLLATIELPPPVLTKIGYIDYLAISSRERKLYANYTSENSLVVIDLNKNELLATIPDLTNVRGVALVSDLRLGFASARRGRSVEVVDLKKNSLLDRIELEGEPDAILYNSRAKLVYVANSSGNSGIFIDPETQKAIATIPLGGRPEYAQSDPKTGYIFQALADTGEIVVIDPKLRTILKRFKVEGGESPTALSYDSRSHRLFIGCQNEKLIVMNSETGEILSTLPIGKGVDFADFDPKWRRIYTANSESQTMSVIEQKSLNEYISLETVPTYSEAHSLLIDPGSHRIYLVHGSSIAVYAPTKPAN